MHSKPRTRHELRCFCSRAPLLGVYGLDSDDKPFIHVKVYKQQRIFGEFIFKGGLVKMRCRECYRWYNIFIREGLGPRLEESEKPRELENAAQTQLDPVFLA